MNPMELHPDRLSTTDEKGRRVFLFPSEVRGKFRTWRTRVQVVLLFIFLCLPWLRIGGRQALLLDISKREFEIFGLSLRAHNAPLLVLVFAALGFGIFFVTSVWGRVWCGWACPQTVFIDGVFRRIEKFCEGSALQRKLAAKTPMTPQRFARKVAKWALFTIAAGIITHSFLAYFVGTERLAEMVSASPAENPGSFLFILISTSIVLFDFAWFREQFCIVVCPYGRMQSVLMDETSMTVAYDTARGEVRHTPESKLAAKSGGPALGDCVNCFRCVQACPVGIDIRRGLQMECIACTACMDACDDVMAKTKKEPGLIRYASQRGLAKGHKTFKPRFGFRPLAYASAASVAVGILLSLLLSMGTLDITVLRAKDTPYTLVESPGQAPIVINHFKLELTNQTRSVRFLTFAPAGKARGLEIVTAQSPLKLDAGQLTRADIFVKFPKNLLKSGQAKFVLKVENRGPSGEIEILEKEVTLVGPFS